MSPVIAVYARYSSDNQRETSIDDQFARCLERVRIEGWSTDGVLQFADRAVSGVSDDREQFQQLRRLVTQRPRGVDVLVVNTADRLSRNMGDADRFYRELEYAGVRLISISDGIDTARKGARMSFLFKAAFSDLYIDMLREETMRGLEGRMKHGFSTGNPPLGYRSEEVVVCGKSEGFRRVIDDDQAALVRRIFELSKSGLSDRSIAKLLNDEGITPPRPVRKRCRPGWVASTIREMLRNEAYIGVFTYKKRQWRKVPGTNTRRPVKQPETEVMRSELPELRIVPQDLWDAVHERRAAVAQKYASAPKKKRKGKLAKLARPGRRTSYPFSGLLACGECGAPMVIIGGSSSRYYRCGDYHKRGTCTNNVPVREEDVRTVVFGELKRLLLTSEGVVFGRQHLAKILGQRNRQVEQDRSRLDKEMTKVMRQIGNATEFIVDHEGDKDLLEPVKEKLVELQERRRRLQGELVRLDHIQKDPVRLPTNEDARSVLEAMQDTMTADPVRAREALRLFFKDGTVVLEPQPDRSYVAKTDVLPLMVIPAARRTKPPSEDSSGASDVYNDGCAGRI